MNRKPRNPPKIGEIFGRLTVLQKTSRKDNKNRNWRYLCQCSCGGTIETVGSSLRSGATTSCGCFRAELHRKNPGEAAWNRLFMAYKRGARKRNLLFSLEFTAFKSLITKDCRYCGGCPLAWNPYEKEHNKNIGAETIKRATIFINGIDRVDNNLGYVAGNCVPCCTVCNKMKLTYGEQFFLEHVQKIAHNLAL